MARDVGLARARRAIEDHLPFRFQQGAEFIGHAGGQVGVAQEGVAAVRPFGRLRFVFVFANRRNHRLRGQVALDSRGVVIAHRPQIDREQTAERRVDSLCQARPQGDHVLRRHDVQYLKRSLGHPFQQVIAGR